MALNLFTFTSIRLALAGALLLALAVPGTIYAQMGGGKSAPATAQAGAGKSPPATPAPTTPAAMPADYVIGPDDVLAIIVWRDKDVSAEVTVRPDGKISLPLLNDIKAAGLTPEQLRVELNAAAAKYIEEPSVSVIVKAINSRKVFVTGQVNKPGPYPLSGPTTVLQLLAMAGGLLEYADEKNIRIMRTENGQPQSFRFNYKDVSAGKNLKQNIELKPGDTVIVP